MTERFDFRQPFPSDSPVLLQALPEPMRAAPPMPPRASISVKRARLRLANHRIRSAVATPVRDWCGPPPPTLSSGNVANRACEAAFREAVKQSSRKRGLGLELWKTAKKTCELHNVNFPRAVDTVMLAGRTPLQHLVRTPDHAALHYVHTCLLPGAYQGNIHLGLACAREPSKTVDALTDDGFHYRGQTIKGNIGGYGIVNWPNGHTYVGTWDEYISLLRDNTERGASAWITAALRATDSSELLLYYDCRKRALLLDHEIASI